MVIKIFIICAEQSGDNLAGKLVSQIKRLNPPAIFKGFGGSCLAAHNIKSTDNIDSLSVMGFIEIIPKLPKIISIMNSIIHEIKSFKPDILITIDAPDFSFRIAEKVKNYA